MYIKRLLLTVILFSTAFIIFSEELNLSDSEIKWLEEHPVIRIGVGTSYPPIQYVTQTNGEYEFLGIASDYVKILSAFLGVEFEVEFGITFKEAMEMGKNKEIDMFPCVAYNDERAEFLEFTEGYLENPIVIFANEDAPFIGSVQDLVGLRVADVEALYIYNSLQKDIPGIEFVLNSNAEECLESVAFGRADANVAGLISGSYLIQKNNWTNIKVAAPSPYPNTVFRMAVRDDWPEFVDIINKALQTIGHDNRNDIKQKWVAVRYEYGIDKRRVALQFVLVIIGASVVVFITLLWVSRLRREIRQRKTVEESLKDREFQLQEMVEEKEILIREVYHRVKNNLSLVASLVSLQASELSQKKDIEKMGMVVGRIQSIILLHEKLSLSSDMEHIDISEYLKELIVGIENTRNKTKSDIEISFKTAKFSFDTKIIIPLGLIITEIVTNALKYGFPEKTSGHIEINLERNPGDVFLLSIKNDGLPISPEMDLDCLKSMGLMLVTNLVAQLDGDLQVTRSPSPEFRISFPYSS
jgi:two-component sensor histidine kinase/ABC-type amino acid transport substrate-binding protein